MSVIISGIRIPAQEHASAAADIALKKYKIPRSEAKASVYRVSIDARRDRIWQVASVEVEFSDAAREREFAAAAGSDVRIKAEPAELRITGKNKLNGRPVVIGFGPCGMFCALTLAEFGYRPVVFERGSRIDLRDRAVDGFQNGGRLDPESNIQFGEGGAGAYSDGKLTTRINDPLCEYVLDALVKYGAPEQIKHMGRPHIGTDILKSVVERIRNRIIELGGTVNFNSGVDNIKHKDGRLCSISAGGADFECGVAALCVGHSARDTFYMLREAGMEISPKAFSMGVRIEHLQRDIDRMMYGKYAGSEYLPPAEYSLSYREGSRGCYSFCMCPGGFVVAAASEQGGVVTNGMSRHARSGDNANAAIAVSVLPEDFEDPTDPLSGVEFQRRYERAAFAATGSYRAPAQLASDFFDGRASRGFERVMPTYPAGVELCDLNRILPEFICVGLKSGLRRFGGRMKGFDSCGAVLTGPETRTSSPVRIVRNTNMMSTRIDGIIPCGEGAGYAGGIMSAAVDGIRAAMTVLAEYAPD